MTGFARSSLALLMSTVRVGLTGQVPAAPAVDQSGTVYEISRDREASTRSSNASTDSSIDRDTLIERVREVRTDGLVLEYNLPSIATAQERATAWQFPLMIFKPNNGPARLLDETVLQQRIATWLKQAKLDRGMCGRTVFTWNAFKIECDPQSALRLVATFDLRPDGLRDGAAYRDTDAAVATVWRMTLSGSGSASFTAMMPIDAEKARRERAEADVVVAELRQQPISPADAARERASEQIAGTIRVVYDLDPLGGVLQRRRTTQTHIVTAKGVIEDRTMMETVSRRRLSGQPAN